MDISEQTGIATASIVILTYNNIDLTRLCIESLFQYTKYDPFEVIIVDNNSQDGTRVFLMELEKQHKNIRLILNETNAGFARGNNQGAAIAEGEYLVFLNNDTVVTQGWLGRLIDHLNESHVGMVGPVTNSSGNESQIPVEYNTLAEMHEFAARYTAAHQNESFEIGMLPFQCVALRRSVFNEIGTLDEEFGLGMFEDDDYALRLKQKGYKILCAEDVFVHHWGSASFSKIGYSAYWQLFKDNLELFEKKWGVKWLPHTQRPEFIPQQYRMILNNSMQFSDQLISLEKRVKDQRLELDNIYQSNSWRFIQSLQRLRRFLIPENSRREDIFHKIIRPTGDTRKKDKKKTPVPVSSRQIKDHPGKIKADSRREARFEDTGTVLVVPKSNGLNIHSPKPLVSVIVPVHNHADLLRSATDSILFGRYPNLELIILDDGSTDDIEPVLRRLGNNPRVNILRQPNQKLPRALTHAHSYARGQFITWTSADNILKPDTIERLVSELIKHPEAVMVYADVGLIDADGQPLHDRSYRPQNLDPDNPDLLRLHQEAIPLSYEADNYINACFMYRREAVQALTGRFAEDLPGLEDYDFWLRMQKSGNFMHIRNREPLYLYRVHSRTMSHEILNDSSALSEHVQRAQRLMEYEAQRRAYAQKRWHLLLDSSLSPRERAEISTAVDTLPVKIETEATTPMPGIKHLRFTGEQVVVHELAYVRNLPHHWRLEWVSTHDGETHSLDVWKGIDIHPLALKARQYQPQSSHFPTAQGRLIVGLHTALKLLPLDMQGTRQFIESNPEIFFALLDIPGGEDYDLGDRIVAGLENAAYLGPKPFGEVYQLYAEWDAVWLPPLTDDKEPQSYRELIALAYAIARPLVAAVRVNFTPAPYQYFYYPPQESLSFLDQLDHTEIETSVLDRYLRNWSRAGCFHKLLNLANAATQEAFIPRPDFQVELPPEVMPKRWIPARANGIGKIKCALVSDSLDKGGLEKVIAQLATGLPDHGIETFILCTKMGGETADTLREMGIRVHVAQGDEILMREILLDESPQLVSSHLADITFLKTAYDLGIPIVETIQNAYIWFDQDAWAVERDRSQYFSNAVAVSQNACSYYQKWNNFYPREWISIIPNGVDFQTVQPLGKQNARAKLGLNDSDFIFLSLASYAPAKNQIGLLAAFERIASINPQAKLVCAGNVADPGYYQHISSYWEKMEYKDRVELREFSREIDLLLSAADVFVLNSIYEGWSLAATEALLAGIPIIHSDCGSGRELVGEYGERGILVPNPITAPINLDPDIVNKMVVQREQANTAYLIDAMQRMIKEQALWETRRKEIRTHAKDSFTSENMVSLYAQLFKRFAIQ